jgi:tetratricopeptide (TPR) repeat protein
LSRAFAALGAFGLLVATSGAAIADPSVWARARDPAMGRRMALLDQANVHVHRAQQRRRDRSPFEAQAHFQEARRLLEQAGGETSPSLLVRVRYANTLNELKDYKRCVSVLEGVVRGTAPAHVLADAYKTLAVCYARVGRHADEIKAYGGALAHEPDAYSRSHLFANRAEAEMALGSLTNAVAGYREAISVLTSAHEMFRAAPTAYWGLAVALDRSGELDAAFEAISFARSYDPNDNRIFHNDNWFFSPEWDMSWYRALGYWQHARSATLTAARTESYLAAVAAWEDYIEVAPPGDRYLPIARARLKACESERLRMSTRVPQSTRVPKRPKEAARPVVEQD